MHLSQGASQEKRELQACNFSVLCSAIAALVTALPLTSSWTCQQLLDTEKIWVIFRKNMLTFPVSWHKFGPLDFIRLISHEPASLRTRIISLQHSAA